MIAARRSVAQENIITELREFIEINYEKALKVLDAINEGTGEPSYVPGKNVPYYLKKDDDWDLTDIERRIKLSLYES